MMNNNKITILAVAGALAVGVVGSNALADDDELPGGLDPVKVLQQDERDDDRDDDRKGDSPNDQARDEDDVDVDQRDEDDDEGGDGGNTHSGGTQDGAADNSGSVGNQPTGDDSSVAVAAAPAPAPAPVYDDDGGSDYGDT